MTLLHQNAFLINLESRRDRLRYAEKQLKKIGWSYERFAVTKPLDAGGYSNHGTRGCAESHFALLRMAAEQGNEPILIMEDDLKPCDDFAAAIQQFHAQIVHRLDGVDIIYYYNHNAGRSDVDILKEPTLCTHFYVARNPRKLLTLCDERTAIDFLYMQAVNDGRIRALSPNFQIVAQNLKCGTDLGSSHEEFARRIGNFGDVFVNG